MTFIFLSITIHIHIRNQLFMTSVLLMDICATICQIWDCRTARGIQYNIPGPHIAGDGLDIKVKVYLYYNIYYNDNNNNNCYYYCYDTTTIL